MIRAITYNCQGLKSSIHDIQSLCSTYDLIFIQESWLFQFELPLLSKIDPDFEGYGISAIDDSTNIVRGRPYGGLAILTISYIQLFTSTRSTIDMQRCIFVIY